MRTMADISIFDDDFTLYHVQFYEIVDQLQVICISKWNYAHISYW